MADSNPQLSKFKLVTGALGYRSRSDPTATDRRYLVSGSQNVLINEATDERPDVAEERGDISDEGGDKVETRGGYELFGASSDDRDEIVSEFRFKTKAGNTIIGRMDANGDLEYYSEQSAAWEELLTGLNGSFPFRTTSAWQGTELLRFLLGVNHDSILYEWSGAVGTLASSTATTIVINQVIATAGYISSGATASIRVKDTGGTWRTFVVTSHAGSIFTVTGDPSQFTFAADALVVQAVRTNANTPASGYTNDSIAVVDNHVFVGSADSSIVYMSQSTDYTSFAFSSPRVPTEGWQFLLDDFTVGFSTNITSDLKQESIVIFAGDDWIYRVEFFQLGDTAVVETASVHPIIVAPGQGAVSQELITKLGNTIVFINKDNELVELGSFENFTNIQHTPLSDPIRPDFIAADFTGGALRFRRNNLFITAPASLVSRMFILSFRQRRDGTIRRFWQPPQILPIGMMTEFDGDLIGHSSAETESYKLFVGTNDNGQAISFKAHFAYRNYGRRDIQKNFDKYYSELYVTSNLDLTHKLVFDFLGSTQTQQFNYKGTDTDHLFTPDPNVSLGVNSLGTSPLGGALSEPENLLKYRRYKPVVPRDFFEMQTRYESDNLDGQWQLVSHGSNAEISKNAKAKINK